MIAGILAEQATGRQLHEVYRELVFDPLGMDATWLEGYEPARSAPVAHHYTDELDWTTISPTVDWGRRRPRHHRSRSSPLRPGALVGADHRLPRAQ